MGLLDIFRPRAEPPEAKIVTRPQALGGEADWFHDLKDPRLADFVRGFEGSAGVSVNSESALRAAAVYGCVRLLSGAIATLPLDIKRRDGPNRLDAEDHPLWRVLRRRPNRFMKPARFRRMLQTHILLRGNAYCVIGRGSLGQIKELVPLHPDRVEPKQDAVTNEISYEYQPPNGQKRTFRQDQIFHLMGMTHDGVRGMSVLSYARETIGLSLATGRHGASFFRNGTNVGSVLTHPKTLGEDAQNTLRSSLEAYRGAEFANRTLVLEEDMKFEKLGMTSTDAQFVETMVQSRTEIAMFFGVPPHMIGDTEKNTSWGTGIEAQARGFVAFTLEDWLTEWEDAVNTDLIGEDEPDVYSRFNRSALVRGDYQTRWDGYVKGLQWGVVSPDEVRAMEDMNPRADGEGAQYYDPPNTPNTPIAAALPPIISKQGIQMSLRKLPDIRAFTKEAYEHRGMGEHLSPIPPDHALARWRPGIHAAVNGQNTISIYDVIGDGGVTAKRIAGALRDIGAQDVTVDVNSPGGDFFEGVTIYSLLKDHPRKVTVRVMGLAASAASVIAMAGDEIQISDLGFLMIHNAWCLAIGNRHDMIDAAKTLEPLDNTMAELYAKRAGVPTAKAAAWMDAETWFTAKEAVDSGLAGDFLPSSDVIESTTKETRAVAAARRIEAALIRANPNASRDERRSLIRDARGDVPKGNSSPRYKGDTPGAVATAMPGAGEWSALERIIPLIHP